LQEVDREFVDWVQRAFVERGLKVDVMFLNPRLPRELIIQRQVVEGVHGVAELDNRAQVMAKIPLQVFDRSAGRQNARFDQYQDLDPKIAAELVMRAKASAQTQAQPPAVYGGGQFPPVSYPPMHQAHQPQQPQYYAGQPPPNANLGALGNLAHLDPATLQKVLAAMQGQGGGPGQPMGAHPGVDINAVLGALGANNQAPTHMQQMTGYGPGPAGPGAPPGNPADQAHVQNIMAQLSRYRQ
jgi:nuclear polyadenylated RNA-binding protein 3